MALNPENGDRISDWMRLLEQGDERAVAELWEYCYPRLLSYSRKKLPDRFRRSLDEEDVALSAFKSFCLRAGEGSLGEIQGQDQLWKLLFCITSRKAQGYLRHLTRQKRGGRGEEMATISGDAENSLQDVADGEATPDMKALFADQCQHLFDVLDDDMLQTIALLRMEGYSVDEVASRVGCAKRSVERRLNMIREIWRSEEV